MQAKKRLFLGLGLLIVFLLMALVLYLSYLTFVDSDTLAVNLIFIVIASLLLGLIILVGFGLLGITLTIIRKKYYPLLNRLIELTLNLFFPIIMQFGKLFQITQIRIQRSFVEVNNQLVEAKIAGLKGKLKGDDLLLLLPHCLQDSGCSKRITNDISNCDECKKCEIANLIKLARKFNINIRVATGGTLARKFIEETRPRLVVAVACERDLTSGILDASPLPVLGLINQRPNGPCMDTAIDVSKIERCLKELLAGGESRECFSSAPQKA